MSQKTTRVKRTSQVQTESADMPLYAVRFPDGTFGIIDPKDIQDVFCPILTAAAHREMYIAELNMTPEQKTKRLIDILKRDGIDTAWMDEV